MKPISFKIHNVRLVKELEINFPSCGVVFIKGKNEVGKSTALKSFGDMLTGNNTTSLAVGIDNSFTEGEFVLPTGETVLVKQDLTKGKQGSRFVLVDQDGNVKKGVNDIKDLFQFNDFTIEEFIDWGKSTEGRREQRKRFLKIFTEDVQKQFIELELDEKGVYNQRTTANNAELTLRNVVEKAKPSDDIFNSAKEVETLSQLCQEAEKIHLNAVLSLDKQKVVLSTQEDKKSKLASISNELATKRELLETRTKFYEEEFKRLQQQKDEELHRIMVDGLNLKAERDKLSNEIENNTSIDLTHLVKEESSCKEKLLGLKSKYDKAKANENQVNNYYIQVKDHKEALDNAKALDAQLTNIRDEKDHLILDADCPIKNIRITPDGLEAFVNNMWLPYDEDHIATSVIFPMTAELIFYINKDLRIVLMSRGESILRDRVEVLLKLAREYDGVFLAERAEEGQKEIVCEIIEA